jgi:hypothetical protein
MGAHTVAVGSLILSIRLSDQENRPYVVVSTVSGLVVVTSGDSDVTAVTAD